jgi:predicted glycosyltransferase
MISKYSIDAVISDNRFGMYNRKIRSIYITHQLLIKTGNSFSEKIAQKIHYRFIKKYDKCWVPDFEINGLAGDLSHPKNLPQNVQYLGCLSRFESTVSKMNYDLLISISGPEPQRTIFEDQILYELKSYTGKVLFIRGLPEENTMIKNANASVEIKNHLSAQELNKAILQSKIIISRCGYTTVMDLEKLKKKAILIPTPGQTEQEYLAIYLMKKQFFYTIDQRKFSLKSCLKEAASFPFKIPEYDMTQYKNVIHEFVRSM